MLRSKLFLCAESASIDSRSNTISAFHIIEMVNVAGFPAVVPRISVLAVLSREETDAVEANIHLEAFLGVQQLFSGPFPANFVGLLSKSVVELQGMVLTGPGDLRFILKNGEEVLGSWSMMISQVGQPQMHLLYQQTPPAPQQGSN